MENFTVYVLVTLISGAVGALVGTYFGAYFSSRKQEEKKKSPWDHDSHCRGNGACRDRNCHFVGIYGYLVAVCRGCADNNRAWNLVFGILL